MLSAHESAVGVLALLALFLLTRASMAGGFGRRRSGGWLMWAGLIALGMFSSLFVLTAARDVALLLFIAAGALGWRPLAGHDLEAISALAVPALAMFASAIGLFNARRLPAVREVELPIVDLPEALAGFAIVQISDLHVGPTIRGPFVSAVVAAANRRATRWTAASPSCVSTPRRWASCVLATAYLPSPATTSTTAVRQRGWRNSGAWA